MNKTTIEMIVIAAALVVPASALGMTSQALEDGVSTDILIAQQTAPTAREVKFSGCTSWKRFLSHFSLQPSNSRFGDAGDRSVDGC